MARWRPPPPSTESRAADLLAQGVSLSTGEVAAKLGVSWEQASSALTILHRAGRVAFEAHAWRIAS